MLLAVFWLIFPAAGCAWVIVTCGPCMVWALLAGTGLVPALLTVPVLVKFKLVKLVAVMLTLFPAVPPAATSTVKIKKFVAPLAIALNPALKLILVPDAVAATVPISV